MQHYMIEKNPDGVWVVIDAIGSRAATSSEIAFGEQIAALTKERDEAKADAHKSRDELEHVKHDCAEEMKNRAAQSAEQQQRIAALEMALGKLLDCVYHDFDFDHPLIIECKAALASGKEGV